MTESKNKTCVDTNVKARRHDRTAGKRKTHNNIIRKYKTMFTARLLTGLILIPIFVLLIFKLSPTAFGYLTVAFTLIGAWEWSNFMGLKSIKSRLCYPFILYLFLPLSVLIPTQMLLFITFGAWIIAFILVVIYPRASQVWGKGLFWRGAMGVMVFVPTWRALNYIRDINDQGRWLLLFLFVLVWGADTGAYISGRRWGKNKLAPKVSPGKTLEGTYGALLISILIGVIASVGFHFPMLAAVVLSLVTVLFSILGDLFESMLKRNVGIKDSGRLFPGHGGLLDRIDSLTAAAPIFALCLQYIVN